MARVTTTVTATLSPLAPTWRRRIKRIFWKPWGPGRLNPTRRLGLASAVFQVEAALEDRRPAHPAVSAMRAVRNLLLDEAGENEPRTGNVWADVERVATRIRAYRQERRVTTGTALVTDYARRYNRGYTDARADTADGRCRGLTSRADNDTTDLAYTMGYLAGLRPGGAPIAMSHHVNRKGRVPS